MLPSQLQPDPRTPFQLIPISDHLDPAIVYLCVETFPDCSGESVTRPMYAYVQELDAAIPSLVSQGLYQRVPRESTTQIRPSRRPLLLVLTCIRHICELDDSTRLRKL